MDRFDSGRSLSPIRQAEAYWTALLTGRGVPKRSEIDPRGLENILEYTFVLERIAPGLTRFRLAGSHLNNLAGMEVRGMPLTAFFEPSARENVKKISEQVFSQPAIATLNLESSGRLGRVQMQARMLFLPLQSDLGDVSRILGVMVSDGAIGATPRRFSVSQANLRAVSNVQVPHRSPQPADAGFAEDQRRYNAPGSHLRLVVSRDD